MALLMLLLPAAKAWQDHLVWLFYLSKGDANSVHRNAERPTPGHSPCLTSNSAPALGH